MDINIKQGDIFYCDLGVPTGSEQGGIRPCIVVQNNVGNKFSSTIIVVPCSSKSRKNNLPTQCEISKIEKNSGLLDSSQIFCEQIRCIDKKRIKNQLPKGHVDIRKIYKFLFANFGLNVVNGAI